MLRLIVLLALALPSFGGGALLLSIGNPDAIDHPAARGAIATARMSSCFGTSVSPASFSVRAVSQSGGKYVTLPVRVEKMTGDLVAIHFLRPPHGEWKLQFLAWGNTVEIPVGEGPLRPQARAVNGW